MLVQLTLRNTVMHVRFVFVVSIVVEMSPSSFMSFALCINSVMFLPCLVTWGSPGLAGRGRGRASIARFLFGNSLKTCFLSFLSSGATTVDRSGFGAGRGGIGTGGIILLTPLQSPCSHLYCASSPSSRVLVFSGSSNCKPYGLLSVILRGTQGPGWGVGCCWGSWSKVSSGSCPSGSTYSCGLFKAY